MFMIGNAFIEYRWNFFVSFKICFDYTMILSLNNLHHSPVGHIASYGAISGGFLQKLKNKSREDPDQGTIFEA